jgi:hypothetical protein
VKISEDVYDDLSSKGRSIGHASFLLHLSDWARIARFVCSDQVV